MKNSLTTPADDKIMSKQNKEFALIGLIFGIFIGYILGYFICAIHFAENLK